MAKVKGTWRFNDVLTQYGAVETVYEFPVNFKVFGDAAISVEVTCTKMSVLYTENSGGELQVLYEASEMNPDVSSALGMELPDSVYVYINRWYTENWGNGIQTIIFTEEQEVSDEFYAWFTANAVELVAYTVSGKWMFREMLTPPGDAFDGAVSFLVDGDSHFDTIYLRTFADKTGMGVEYANITTSGDHTSGEMIMVYADGEYGALMGVSGWADDAYRTIDFGTESQVVSAEFYNWLTGNAVQSNGSLLYRGETIAELFPGQTVTLKCGGMRMEDDVVVRV
jgi:hypothetical protein